jgi:hypothetical protein
MAEPDCTCESVERDDCVGRSVKREGMVGVGERDEADSECSRREGKWSNLSCVCVCVCLCLRLALHLLNTGACHRLVQVTR